MPRPWGIEAGCAAGTLPPAMSAAMRRAISSISRSVRRVAMTSLPVLLDVADVPGVDDGHDDGIDGPLVGDHGLPGRAAGGDQDDFVLAGADGIGGHDGVAGRLPLFVERTDDEQLEPLDAPLLARADDRSDASSER